MSDTKHWTDPLRAEFMDNNGLVFKNGTLAEKIYLAACYTHGNSETECREIGRIAHEQNTSIWHASSIYHNTLDRCMCQPCLRRRAK